MDFWDALIFRLEDCVYFTPSWQDYLVVDGKIDDAGVESDKSVGGGYLLRT